MLVRNLKHNMKFFNDHQVIIVNDDPDESIRDDVKNIHNILLLENTKNLGFSGAVNTGMKAAQNKYVLILNSDVTLEDRAYEACIKQFQHDKELFAVSCAQSEQNGTLVGCNRLFWLDGFIQHTSANGQEKTLNGWAEGGAMMVDKSKFDQLGGFDTLFAPFYWEDIDLSYRAWKCGYHIQYDPDIRMNHPHESTIGKYFRSGAVRTIAYRNQIQFVWKNITDKKLFRTHINSLPRHVIRSIVRGDLSFPAGLLKAVMRLPAVLRARQAAKQSPASRTDREILDLFS